MAAASAAERSLHLPTEPRRFEVRDPNENSWYLATIKNVKDGRFLVEFHNNWKPEHWVEAVDIRPAVPGLWNASTQDFRPVIGQQVEALTRASGDSQFGWWLATVRHERQGYYVLNYDGLPESSNEIVELETLRPVNPAATLNSSPVYTEVVAVSADLRDWAKSFAQHAFANLTHACDVYSITYDAARAALIIAGAAADKIKKARILTELQLRHEGEISRLHARKAAVASQLEEAKKKVESQFKLEFEVPRSVLGLVIGKEGKNIQRAQKLPGVDSVNVKKDSNVVVILAKNEEAANSARNMLEYVESVTTVPQKLVGWIVGQGGANIREIEQKAELLSLNVESDKSRNGRVQSDRSPPPPGMAYVVAVGRKDAVECAELLLQQHMKNHDEVQAAEQETREINYSLNQLRFDSGLVPEFSGRGGRGGRGARGGRGGFPSYRQQREVEAEPEVATPAPVEEPAEPVDQRRRQKGGKQRAQNKAEAQPAVTAPAAAPVAAAAEPAAQQPKQPKQPKEQKPKEPKEPKESQEPKEQKPKEPKQPKPQTEAAAAASAEPRPPRQRQPRSQGKQEVASA